MQPKSPKRKALEDNDEEEEEEKDIEDTRKKRKVSSHKQKFLEMERLEQERIRQEELKREKKKEEEEEKIKIMIEETDDKDVMNELMLKKMILLFEKRTLKNREMRIKFPDNAEK